MPESIQKYRDASAGQGAKQVGLHLGQSFLFQSDQQGRGFEAEIVNLPQDLGTWQPLQDLDPSSPTFGLSYFLPGYDIPGDPTKIVR